MKNRRAVLSLTLMLVPAMMLAEAAESRPWDRQVRLSVSAEAKPKVVALLTEMAGTKGLIRTPAAPGLNELKGREVTFFSFGRERKEMLVTITDVLEPDELQIRAYYEAKAPGLVEAIVADLAKRSLTIPGVRLVQDEKRQ